MNTAPHLKYLFSLLLWGLAMPYTAIANTGLGALISGPSTTLEEWYNAGAFMDYKGQEIYYQTLGEGPALLLIHGYPYSSYDFHRIAKSLALKHRVIVFDLPGMGFSDKGQVAYSFEDYVDLVNHLLVRLKVNSVDVLGHDLGSSVVQELVARGDQNSVVINSAAFMNGGLFSDVYRPRMIQRVLSQSPDWFGGFISSNLTRGMVEGSVVRLFGPNTLPDQTLLDDWWGLLNYKDGKAVSHRLGRLVFDKVDYQDRWISAMQNTSIPMIYLCGPADPNSGLHMAERYKALIPHSSVTLLDDDIGHWPQLEAPEQLLAAYQDFLQSK